MQLPYSALQPARILTRPALVLVLSTKPECENQMHTSRHFASDDIPAFHRHVSGGLAFMGKAVLPRHRLCTLCCSANYLSKPLKPRHARVIMTWHARPQRAVASNASLLAR
jgi:hypothetical protein